MSIKNKWSIILVAVTIIACSTKPTSYKGKETFVSSNGEPDYSKLEYWAAHPNKWDPSDSIPEPLRGIKQEKIVDVFFVHPTTLTELRDTIYTNAKIDDSIINYKTDYSAILYQASVFNERANIYAPRYRQAHIQMYFSKDSLKQREAFELAYNDVKSAFEYYLKNLNRNRPIIIASHSQGTTHCIRLIKEYFDNTPLRDKLVCAYLIGMGVNKNYYETIKPCSDSSKVSCYNTWRTYRQDYIDKKINHSDTSIAVTNPISWSIGNEVAKKEDQKGAILYNFNKIFTHTQSAKAEGNALWVSHPKFPGSILYNKKNYHIGDINLFYVDIRNDVSRRIDSYLKNKEHSTN